jgi:hypothetical protein
VSGTTVSGVYTTISVTSGSGGDWSNLGAYLRSMTIKKFIAIGGSGNIYYYSGTINTDDTITLSSSTSIKTDAWTGATSLKFLSKSFGPGRFLLGYVCNTSPNRVKHVEINVDSAMTATTTDWGVKQAIEAGSSGSLKNYSETAIFGGEVLIFSREFYGYTLLGFYDDRRNYAGIAQETKTSGNDVIVATLGTIVNREETLIPGYSYGYTEDDLNNIYLVYDYKAGEALSASKLLITK